MAEREDMSIPLRLALAVNPCAPDDEWCLARGDDSGCAQARRILTEAGYVYSHARRMWWKPC